MVAYCGSRAVLHGRVYRWIEYRLVESGTVGYSAKMIANYFLSRYGEHGISPLKIQKLVYIAHGWHWAFFDAPLVDDEYAEAWEYGPVYPSLYHEFKHRGRMPIIDLATDLSDDLESITPVIPNSNKTVRNLLDRVWTVYGKYTDFQISTMCNRNGSPWSQAREQSQDRYNANIPDYLIKDYYKKKLQRSRECTANFDATLTEGNRI